MALAALTQVAPVRDQPAGRLFSLMVTAVVGAAIVKTWVPAMPVSPSTWVGVLAAAVVTVPVVCTVLVRVKPNGPPAPPIVVLRRVSVRPTWNW